MKTIMLTISLSLGLQLTAIAEETVPSETAFDFIASDGTTAPAFKGEIWVPENRTVPNSTKIPVRYIRFPATGDTKGSPIFYLAGGPGGSGIRTVKHRRTKMFMALRAYGDVIAIDQRGAGRSKVHSECQSSITLPIDKRLSDHDFIGFHQNALRECIAQWQDKKIDIAGYNTIENADDLNDLRRHFGAKKMILWGTSYGSHLAFAALKKYDDVIEKVILSSAEGPDQTVKRPAATNAWFDRLQTAINSQPASKKLWPDVKGLVTRVHQKLETNPLNLTLKMRDGSKFDYLFQKRDIQQIASFFISDPTWTRNLLGLYSDLDQGNGEKSGEIIARFFNPGRPLKLDLMSTMMDIASGISIERKARIKKELETAILGSWMNFSWHYDALYPEYDLGKQFRMPTQSRTPLLLFSGTLDGRTYLQQQQSTLAEMPNAVSIIVENAGHNLFMSSPEIQKTINLFLENKPIKKKTITIPLVSLTSP
ncbi:alpha/beta hydrolase [Temperatibacter marinus]|uniref:Proline iminopeptidase n=1 Tax=Temperatibacter marinus TaxID=1456591 RepID=A0AA52ECM1_9PROT|nr:alpha/beta hydrolase [Temperatibacter marinus]WND02957.1 alpha/beta hydrolase [Temperatibacter marinus]